MRALLLATAAALLRAPPAAPAAQPAAPNASAAPAAAPPKYPVITAGAGLPSSASGYEFNRDYPASVEAGLTAVPGARMFTWKDHCLSCNAVIHAGVWEPVITEAVLTALRADPQPALMDVGSQAGYYSVMAAAQGIPALSVEGFDQNAWLLRRTAVEKGYAMIFLVEKAVTEPAAATGRGCIGGGDGVGQANGRLGVVGDACKYRPRLTTVDQVLATEFPAAGWAARPITVLKMDIETAEVRALQGAAALLKDPARKPCVMQVEYIWDQNGGRPRPFFCNLVRNHGYIVARMLGQTGGSELVPPGGPCQNGDYALLADPPPRPACAAVAAALRKL